MVKELLGHNRDAELLKKFQEYRNKSSSYSLGWRYVPQPAGLYTHDQ
jgi:hypothetical protein